MEGKEKKISFKFRIPILSTTHKSASDRKDGIIVNYGLGLWNYDKY